MTIPWCLKRAELVFKCVKGKLEAAKNIRQTDTATYHWELLTGIIFCKMCFLCRFHDGNGFLGWRYITYSPVSSAKGEIRVCIFSFATYSSDSKLWKFFFERFTFSNALWYFKRIVYLRRDMYTASQKAHLALQWIPECRQRRVDCLKSTS